MVHSHTVHLPLGALLTPCSMCGTGDPATAQGIASSPDTIGMLFSVSMTAYTLACPIIGYAAKRERFGPRPVIVFGLLLQLMGFLLIGP